MINQLLDNIGVAVANNIWLAPVLAFVGGVLTSFTPCCLSSVPLVIGCVGGYAGNDTKKAFKYSAVFCIGTAITFTALGTAASLMGRIMSKGGSWWYIVLGILMLLMALQTWEVIYIIPQNTAMGKNNKTGYIGALIAGVLGGLFSSPCATPVLVVLLAMVASSGNIAWGILLLLLYSLGHSILLMIAGTSVGFVRQLSSSDRFGKYNTVFKLVMGLAIFILALYMFYLGF